MFIINGSKMSLKTPAAPKKEITASPPKEKTPIDQESGVSFGELCAIFEQIEAITGRLEISSILSTFLAKIMKQSPSDLLFVVYLCLCRLGPTYEGLELGLGEALLIKAIAGATGRTAAKIKSDIEAAGDVGLVAQESKSSQTTMFKPKALFVKPLFKALKEIASLSGASATTKKVERVKSLLVACQGIEAKYLFRLLEGKLRIGLAEQTLLGSLAVASLLSRDVAVEGGTEKAIAIIKAVYTSLPNYNLIIPALLEHGIWELPKCCKLTPGIPLKPMLAYPTRSITEVLDRFEGIPFTCEFKYDGERAQIHRTGEEEGQRVVYSRNSENMTQKYPDLLETMLLAECPETHSYVLDAEVVAWDKAAGHLLPFQILSTRKRKDVTVDSIQVVVCLFAFDLLYLNGVSLVEEPLEKRRQLLWSSFREIPGQFQFAKYANATATEQIESFLEEAIQSGCEGLMVKTLEQESSYEPSKRSRKWLKVKKDYLEGCGDSLDLVVIGGYAGRGKRRGVYGGFLLACFDDQTEEYQAICKIGTGFSDADLEAHSVFFQDKLIDAPKSYYRCSDAVRPDLWFEPVQVWEIRAADLSLSPVYSAGWGNFEGERGVSLRFPRFIRIRDDKTPEEATTASQVYEMYNSQVLMKKNGGGNQQQHNEEEDY